MTRERVAKILIAEDEPGIALGLEDDLRMEGYEVEVAADGLTAVRRAKESRFDLMLLDIMLPGKDGFEVCRELRRAGLHMPVMMLTAKTQESEKVMAFELGADDYVTKPFGTRELRARIKALLRRANGDSSAAESRLCFGEIELDFDRGELRKSGVPVELTATEFKLLSVLARAEGRILTRGQLMDAVWGVNTFASERIVDNHIANLRRKIEQDNVNPQHLKNIRGLGYRFDA
jgi:DNA-binding response OmpR family regulator